MNKKSIITALLAIVSMAASSQQVMLADSITKNPVGYATVYDANGTVTGRSDMGGHIHLQKGFEYHISHISYEPKSLVYNEDSIIFLSPSSYKISEVSVTAKKKKYYHCKVYFRSIEHVDSCLKYYMDGIREFFIDIKSKKVHCGNIVTNYWMSKRTDIAQKKRSMMMEDRYMALPFLDKSTLYEETMRDKKINIEKGIVYADSIPIGSCEVLSDKNEMFLSIDALWPKNTLVTNLFGRSTSGRLLPKGRKNADDFLGDAHDAAHGLIVHAHFVEDEARGVVGGLLIIRKSRGARCNICVELCTFVDERVNKSIFLCPILKIVRFLSYL